MSRITVLISLVTVAALSSGVAAPASSDQVQARVQRVLATLKNLDDAAAVGLELKLNVQFTATSPNGASVPRFDELDGKKTRVALLGVQSRQSDGSWAYVVQSSWYDTGAIQYAPCTSMAAGGSAEARDVGAGFVLLRKQLAGLGPTPTLRLNLMIFCRQSDGKVLATPTTSDAFSVTLPEAEH